MTGKGKRNLQATIPPDRVRALAIYWLRADVMHTLVHDTEDAWLAVVVYRPNEPPLGIRLTVEDAQRLAGAFQRLLQKGRADA